MAGASIFACSHALVTLPGNLATKASANSRLNPSPSKAGSSSTNSITLPYKVDGNKVTFTATLSSDEFRILGVDSINVSYELQVRDEQITSIVATPDSADWAKLIQLNSGGIGVSLTLTDKGARVTRAGHDMDCTPSTGRVLLGESGGLTHKPMLKNWR